MRKILTILAAVLSVSTAFGFSGSGSGTFASPYLVTSASEFNEVRNDLTAYYKQMNDITLSGEWTPIGNGIGASSFSGTYDGNGYKITGLTITSYAAAGAGLFGYNTGTIKNLGVSGSISGVTNSNAGILAGSNYIDGTIQNCYSEGSITSSSNYVGGLLGSCNQSTVYQCYSTATVTANGTSSTSIGGLIGHTVGTGTGSYYIGECFSTGSVTNINVTSNTGNTGGFIGVAVYNISNCYSTGNVSHSNTNTPSYAGGFVGRTQNSPTITYCYSTGSVTGTSTKGGFVGFYNTGTFTGCFFDQSTSGSTQSYGAYQTSAPTGITAATTAVMKTPSTFTSAGWSTSVWSLVSGYYPMLLWQIPATSIFTGTGNWSESARWSNGLPGATTTVTISGTCTVDANYTVAALTITSGHDLHIDPGHILTITGTLTNSAGTTGLILESDATGTGMLMNNSTGVQATVEQYIKKYQWHFMGIPVTGVPDVNVPLHGCYVIWIDESDAHSGLSTGWQYLETGNSMKVMGGYAVRFGWDASLFPKSVDTTITFSGILNTGVQDTIFSSETEGWNLISNPYPVTMDWDASGGKTLTNTNDAFHLWNPNLNSGNGDYGSYGSYISGGSTNGQTQYIPPMQGFFIEVWHMNSAISFNNACKVAVSSPVFCDAGNLPVNETNPLRFETATSGKGGGEPSIKLAITSNGLNYDETLIRVNDNATDFFDGHFDAVKFKAIESKLSQLYSVYNGSEYSINTVPELNDRTVIPLRVLINETGVHQMVIKELRSFPLNSPLILYDQEGKVMACLNEANFEFDATKGEIKSFYLGFGQGNPNDIIALHRSVNDGLAQYAQVVFRPAGQGSFAVQRRQVGKTGTSVQSFTR